MTKPGWPIVFWLISFARVVVPSERCSSPQDLTKLITSINKVVCLVLRRELLAYTVNDQDQISARDIRLFGVHLGSISRLLPE